MKYLIISRADTEAGVFPDGMGLHPSSQGARIDFKQGQSVDTDGPFAETKDQLAGFYMLEAKDLDEMIALAEKIPPARYGSVEIRPARELLEQGNQAGAGQQ